MRVSRVKEANEKLEATQCVSVHISDCITQLLDGVVFTGSFSKRSATIQLEKELMLFGLETKNAGGKFSSWQTERYLKIRLNQIKQIR